jgi:hypothetical protein
VRLADKLSDAETPHLQQKLFYIPDQSTFVFTRPLLNLKGSDASNIFDEEVAENVLSALILLF